MSHALFDKVYVEKRASEDKVTGEILERLGNPSPEYIGHYKDLFDAYRPSEEIKVSGRGGVSSANESRSLILAHNPGKRLYEGAPVCQSFGNEHFYYSPCVMNCIYDCEYCFLKGMYPGRAICVFTDIDETFAELDEIEKEHDAYVCASYNTDLVALEDVTGYVEKWCSKTASDKKLTTEIRTKCSRTDIYGKLPISDRVIFAFTLSPDEIIRDYEKGTPFLEGRLKAVQAAADAGFSVRLCFDPMIYVRKWREMYGEMVRRTADEIKSVSIKDISIGTFRISDQYLKNMRKKYPDSQIAQYPYVSDKGYSRYPDKVADAMEDYMKEQLDLRFKEVPVFCWR